MLFLSGAALALLCVWLASCGPDRLSGSPKHTFSSFDPPRGPAAALQFDAGMLKLTNADLDRILNLYQEVSARTVIRATNLPQVKISLHNQTPLTRVETLQLLDTTLFQNGVTMVLVGDTAIKAVPNRDALSEVPPSIDVRAGELPDSDSLYDLHRSSEEGPGGSNRQHVEFGVADAKKRRFCACRRTSHLARLFGQCPPHAPTHPADRPRTAALAGHVKPSQQSRSPGCQGRQSRSRTIALLRRVFTATIGACWLLNLLPISGWTSAEQPGSRTPMSR